MKYNRDINCYHILWKEEMQAAVAGSATKFCLGKNQTASRILLRQKLPVLSQNAKKSAGLKTNPFVNRNSRMTHQQSGQAAMPFWGLHRKCGPIIKLNNVKHLNGILFFFGRRLLSCRRPPEALRQALHGFFGNLQIANLCFAKNGRRNIWSIFRGFNDYGV